MTSDALLAVQCIFTTIWSLFTSWYIPGTNVTPAQFFLFLSCASLGITFIVRMITLNPAISSHDSYFSEGKLPTTEFKNRGKK